MNKIFTVIASLAALMMGILFFFFYNNWVTLTLHLPGFTLPVTRPLAPAVKKAITFWYWHKQELRREKKELLWPSDPIASCTHLVHNWLNLLDEENVIQKPCMLQALCLSRHTNELFISLDRSLFDQEKSALDKWMLAESLLKTLRDANIPAQSIRFLVHHAPLQDPHLDFSLAWPISGFLAAPTSIEYSLQELSEQMKTRRNPEAPLTIMFDPAGDALAPGRIIAGTFERGLTLQCAEQLKEALEIKLNNARVILTRLPGQALEPLQSATFANKLRADLYLSVNFYQEESSDLQLSLSYCSYDPTSDSWYKPDSSLSLTAYNQAYKSLFKANRSLADMLTKALKSSGISLPVTIRAPYGIPCKPLVGISIPALALECGLKNKDDWKALVPYVAEAISACLKDLALDKQALLSIDHRL